MTWSAEQLHDLLPRAKALKQTRIEELNEAIAEHERLARIYRSRLQETERMVPADFFEAILDSDKAALERQEDEKERIRLHQQRALALDDAYIQCSGILPPEVASIKGLRFLAFGAFGGGATSSILSLAIWGASSQVITTASLVVGAIAGAIIGHVIFSKNFTIDPSLEYSERWLNENRFAICRRTLTIPK